MTRLATILLLAALTKAQFAGDAAARGGRVRGACGARDAADGRGRTRRGLNSFGPCTEILSPWVIWMITTCVRLGLAA